MSKLIAHLREQGYVNDTNDKIVSTGLKRLKSLLCDIAFSLLLGLLLGDLLAGLLFELSYSIVRIYAGGYHASTERICIWLTYISTLLCIVLIFYLPLIPIAMNILLGISIVVLFVYSPIENANKPLNQREKGVYRKKCLFTTLLEALLYFVFLLARAPLYAKAVCFALAMVALGQIIDCLQNISKRQLKH